MIRKMAILLIVGTLCLLNVNVVGSEYNEISERSEMATEINEILEHSEMATEINEISECSEMATEINEIIPERSDEITPLDADTGHGEHAGWHLTWNSFGEKGLIVTDVEYRDISHTYTTVVNEICVPWIRFGEDGLELFRLGGDAEEPDETGPPSDSGETIDPFDHWWSIWAYYDWLDDGYNWGLELNYIFYDTGIFRLVCTFHKDSGTYGSAWIIPFFIDWEIVDNSNYACELIDPDGDNDAETIWQEQLTGINSENDWWIGAPPYAWDGKFWVRNSGSTRSVVMEAESDDGRYIWLENEVDIPDTAENPEELIDGENWRISTGSDLEFYNIREDEIGRYDTGSMISRFYTSGY